MQREPDLFSQAAWIEAERAAGGHTIVARSLGDVLDALRAAEAQTETHTGR